VFIEAKDDGGGGDNWTPGAISRAKLQSNHHHQQTNIQFFYRPDPFLSPNQQWKIAGLVAHKLNAVLLFALVICRTVLHDLSVLAIHRTMQINSRPTEIIIHFWKQSGDLHER